MGVVQGELIWAILFYGQERVSREKIRNTYQSNALLSGINYLEARQKMQERKAENTANRDALTYFRLLETLGLKDTEVADQRLMIQELEELAEDNSENENLYKELVSAQKHAKSDTDAWKEHEKEHEPWLRIVARLEIAMVVLGTLQWGYGDRWVKIIHDTPTPLRTIWFN